MWKTLNFRIRETNFNFFVGLLCRITQLIKCNVGACLNIDLLPDIVLPLLGRIYSYYTSRKITLEDLNSIPSEIINANFFDDDFNTDPYLIIQPTNFSTLKGWRLEEYCNHENIFDRLMSELCHDDRFCKSVVYHYSKAFSRRVIYQSVDGDGVIVEEEFNFEQVSEFDDLRDLIASSVITNDNDDDDDDDDHGEKSDESSNDEQG